MQGNRVDVGLSEADSTVRHTGQTRPVDQDQRLVGPKTAQIDRGACVAVPLEAGRRRCRVAGDPALEKLIEIVAMGIDYLIARRDLIGLDVVLAPTNVRILCVAADDEDLRRGEVLGW